MESSRTHFEVLGLSLEAYKSSKMSCPWLEDSTFFDMLKMGHAHYLLFILPQKTAETTRKICRDLFFFGESLIFRKKSASPLAIPFFFGGGLEKSFGDIFLFGEHLRLVSLASDFFCILGLQGCILESTSVRY